jgi:hypothetical protein
LEQWAELPRIPKTADTEQRFRAVLDLYPYDLLFVHRDAEGQAPKLRRREIFNALRWAHVRHIPVVPVRMTESWLLINEAAIRCAAGNRNGTDNLDLPELRRLEGIPDPKSVLRNALMAACGLNARRRASLPVNAQVHRIPAFIDDYSSLDVLPAFQALQEDIKQALAELCA